MKKQAIMGLALMLLMGCSSQKIETEKKEPMLTFQDIKGVEYGDSFEVSNLVKDVQGVIKDYPKLDTLKVGKQSLTFVVELDQTKKDFQFDIEVKDTKHPIIELKKDKITINTKEKIDVLKYVQKIKDPVDGDLKYIKENQVKKESLAYYTYHESIDYSKPGTYKIHFTAIDNHQNKTEKDLLVVVKEEKPIQKTTSTVHQKEQETTSQNNNTTKPQKETKKELDQKDYQYVLTSTVDKMKAAQGKNKMVIVTAKAKARKCVVQYFEKQNNQWVEKMKTNGLVGKAGIGVGSENSTRTPMGVFHFTHAYGIKANPGSVLAYTQINQHHYWCGDQYYNQFVDETQMDHSQCSHVNDEHLIDYPGSYNYFLSYNYNSSCIKGKGFAYFLHCARGNYTMGCVGVNQSNMVYLMQRVDSSTGFVVSLINQIENY